MKRFGQFLVVGASGTLIDFLLFYVFYFLFGWQLILSNILSYGTGLTSSFFWNRAWTFQDSKNTSRKMLWISLGFGYVGLALNTVMVWGLDKIMPVMMAKVCAVVTVVIYNYLVNKYLVFKV